MEGIGPSSRSPNECNPSQGICYMVRIEGFEPSCYDPCLSSYHTDLKQNYYQLIPIAMVREPGFEPGLLRSEGRMLAIKHHSLKTYRQNCVVTIPLEPNYNGCFKVANSMSGKRSA